MINRRKMVAGVAVAPVAIVSPAKSQPIAIELDCFDCNAPTQAWGRVNGHPFYFRARGDSWSVEINASLDRAPMPDEDSDNWYRGLWTYEDKHPQASWMERDEAMRLIRIAAEAYTKRA